MAYSKDTKIDEASLKSALVDLIYPVGSIYMSVTNTSPQSFLGGSWEALPEGYALWTASSGAGETIPAGLPNIFGNIACLSKYNTNSSNDGAFVIKTSGNYAVSSAGSNAAHYNNIINFNASRCSEYYGNSDKVQPPAYKIYAWKRTQ